MKYYEMHDQVYQKLQAEGFVSWDKDPDLTKLNHNSMLVSLSHHLQKINRSLSQLKTLDLGTGTGVCALYCAQEGALATGVDVSVTAIGMAKKNAETLELNPQFIVADILNLELQEKFQLITDSSLLHCLIGEDRKKFYSTVKRHLERDGLLYIHTMVASPDMTTMFDPKYFVFEAPILWSLGISTIVEGRKIIKGQSYFPHRTILKEEEILAELLAEGFRLLNHKTEDSTFTGLLGMPHS